MLVLFVRGILVFKRIFGSTDHGYFPKIIHVFGWTVIGNANE